MMSAKIFGCVCVLSFFFLSFCLDTLDCKICRGVLLFVDARRRWVSAKMATNFSTLEKAYKKGTGENRTKVRENVFFLCPAQPPLNICLCLPFENMRCMEVILRQSKNISLILSWLPTLKYKVHKYKHTTQFPRTFLRPSLTLNSFRVGRKKTVTLKTEGLGNETRLLIKTDFQ